MKKGVRSGGESGSVSISSEVHSGIRIRNKMSRIPNTAKYWWKDGCNLCFPVLCVGALLYPSPRHRAHQ
jgi:hypothetical protein